MPTTRRTKGAVLAPVYDDPMPRKQRSRGTSVASSQRSNDRSHDPAPAFNALSRLASHNEELTAENENLRHEIEKQKSKRWTLRDKQLASQIAEHRSTHSAEPEPEAVEQPKQTPAKTPKQRSTAQQTPARSSPPPITTPTSMPRWRQFLSSFTGFTPFSARRPTEPATEPPRRQEHSPLGELPQSRKRPASTPEAEDETPVKRVRTPEKEDASHTSKKPPTSASKQLDTINEQSEPAQRNSATVRPATPTRALRKRTAKTPQTEKVTRKEMQPPATSSTHRRTIRDARQSRETTSSTIQPTTRALKRWETPIKPKEPNADKRLARMQQLEKLKAEKQAMEAEIARLAAEQEADGIDTRKRKRVKVDELAYIPHNKPGDAIGTFRVPDWDSDDEMEVDEEVPVRKNVFVANAEQKSGLEAPKPPFPQTFETPALPQTTTTPAPLNAMPKKATPSAATAATTIANTSSLSGSLFTPAAPAVPKPQFTPISQPQLQQPSNTPAPVKQAPAPFPEASQTATKHAAPKKTFAWPNVGLKSPSEAPWPEHKRIAGAQKFARGFEAWKAVSLQAH